MYIYIYIYIYILFNKNKKIINEDSIREANGNPPTSNLLRNTFIFIFKTY